jgi:hypothetical protein
VRTLLFALPDLQPEAERRREAMNIDEWREQAGREAYAAFTKTLVHNTVPFDDLNEHDQQAWYDVARAVLAEGKIEVRHSAELAEAATRDENERLMKIAQERAEDAQTYRDAADELRSKLDGLRRAYDHACAQRDKYMRRTAEWRSAALDGWDLPENILADMHWAVNEVGQTHRDNCDEAEDECGICKRFAEMKERYPEDDGGGK